MFSSKQYAWSDISVSIGGKVLQGITAIEYTQKREKELIYGRGDDPHSIGRGKNSYEGKVSIWQSELEAMVQSTASKNVLSLSFDLIVSYVPEDGGPIVTDILQNVEFTEVKKSMKQGDKNMIIEMPIIFTKVKLQK